MNDCKLNRWIRVSSLILFMTFTSTFVFGDSLSMVLTSNRAGKFDYEVSNPGLNVGFLWTDTISLTGLSRVTGATASSDLAFCFTSSFTSSSVTLTQDQAWPSCSYINFPTIGTLEVSSLAPLGTVHYGIQADIGQFSGTVGGPAVPEPSSLLMLGSGVLGIAGVICRKLS